MTDDDDALDDADIDIDETIYDVDDGFVFERVARPTLLQAPRWVSEVRR